MLRHLHTGVLCSLGFGLACGPADEGSTGSTEQTGTDTTEAMTSPETGEPAETTSDAGTTSAAGTSSSTADASGDVTGSTGSATAAESSTTTDARCIPYSPWLHEDFEGVAAGESLSDNQPFDAAGSTVASDAQAYAGTQSAQMEIREGDEGGFGRWGGIITLPDVAEGETVWVRLWAYWPSDFEFSAAPWMKFMRLHDRRADGSNGGYNDLYIDNADGPESVLRIIKEVHNIWEVYDGDPIPRDQWERYEIQIVVDDTSVDDGGEGRFRVWRDDVAIFDRTDVPTVSGPGGVLDGLYLFTYWNNELPPNNVAYIDELAITFGDNPPPQLDAEGRPYFGDWLPCP